MTNYGDVPLLDPATGRFPDEFAPPAVAAGVTAATAAADRAKLADESANSAASAAASSAGVASGSASTASGAATTATGAANTAGTAASNADIARVAAEGARDESVTASELSVEAAATAKAITGEAVEQAIQPGGAANNALYAAIDGKTAAPIAAKMDRTPLRQYGMDMTAVDRGHLFLAFDPTGAIIASLTRSAGGRSLGRSTDNGKTWTMLGTPNPANSTASLWFTSAGSWLAYSAGSLYRSTDSGMTWASVAATGTLMARGIAQESDGTLWASEYLGSARVWRSTNDGATWSVFYDFPNTDDGSGTVIRHIHGVRSLPSGLWLVTGDNNTHCGLWRLEGGTFVRKSPAVGDLGGAQRWRTVDLVERGGWLYWAQDGASAAGDIPAIVKAHPSDLAGTLTVLAEIPTGGWYMDQLATGEILVGCVNEGIGKESDRTARVWIIDNDDTVSEIWSAPAAKNISAEFIAARNLEVRASDGMVAFVINQTEFTGGGTSAQATILGTVSPGVGPLAVTRANTPRAYVDTVRAWNTPAPATQSVATGSGLASYQIIPEMELDINSETTRPIVVTLNLDCRINTANQYAYVRLIATDKVTGGVVAIGRPIRYGATTYGPVVITGLFTPAGAGDYILRAEWFATGSAIADSGAGYRQITAWQV